MNHLVKGHLTTTDFFLVMAFTAQSLLGALQSIKDEKEKQRRRLSQDVSSLQTGNVTDVATPHISLDEIFCSFVKLSLPRYKLSGTITTL